MINLILGISLTLNVVLIVGIFLYFKIKAFGLKKENQYHLKNYNNQFLQKNTHY